MAVDDNCGRYVRCVIQRKSVSEGKTSKTVLIVRVEERTCPPDQYFSRARKECDEAQNVVSERKECNSQSITHGCF